MTTPKRTGWGKRATTGPAPEAEKIVHLEELWEQFFYQLRVRRRSNNTVTFYRVTQRQLVKFIAQYPTFPANAEKITVIHLRAFVLWLGTRGLAAGGVHAHVRAIKALFNWAVREELMVNNPALRLERPQLSKDAMPAVTPEQARTLLATARDSDQPLRDVAMLMLMYDTGLRAAEVCNVKLSGLDAARGLVSVVGKGNKPRTVPMGLKAFSAVTAYVRKERNPLHEGIDQLFLARTGTPLTPSGLGNRLVKLSATAGLRRAHTTPHAFRRGFAVEYLRQGGDVFTLQQIMGHTTLEMTRRYVNYLSDDLKSAHLRFSPGDGLRRTS